ETLLRDLVGLDVVDADLEKIEARPIQLLDALRNEKVAVGDEPGHHAEPADPADQRVEIGMEQRLAAAEGDHRGAERLELVDAPVHGASRNRRGEPAVP